MLPVIPYYLIKGVTYDDATRYMALPDMVLPSYLLLDSNITTFSPVTRADAYCDILPPDTRTGWILVGHVLRWQSTRLCLFRDFVVSGANRKYR